MKTLLAAMHHATWNRRGASISGSDFSASEIVQATEEIEKLIADRDRLLEALLNALPYVEDVLADKDQLACFKAGVVEKHAASIRAAIAKATGEA